MPEIAPQAYKVGLRSLLRASTLTPGTYVPTDGVKAVAHAAVLAWGRPVLLCGPADDPASRAQAERLAGSPHAGLVFRARGGLTAGTIRGGDVGWDPAGMSAIVAKPAGAVEEGGGEGPLVAIVLDDPHRAVATALCVATQTARALDPDAPELDDGWTLPALARGRNLVPRLLG
jgi:putative DNA primase/helicase